MRTPATPAKIVGEASYALEVARAIAHSAWEDWSPGSVPFVIVHQDYQWIFRATEPPVGYERGAFSSQLGPVYRALSWTRYDGARVPFKPPHFFAQTDRARDSLTFTIAAPSTAPFPISDWAAVFTHEYFHAFQLADKRWTEDLPLLTPRLRKHLAELYQRNPLIRKTIERELEQYLRWLSREPIQCADFAAAGVVRRERSKLLEAIDPRLPKAERALERFEGIARYVEETAYELNDVTKLFRIKERSWSPITTEKMLHRRLAVSRGEYYYATGYALARLLEACAPSWQKRFAGKDLFALLSSPNHPQVDLGSQCQEAAGD